MASRVVAWFVKDSSDLPYLPKFYVDADYEKADLKIYASEAPITGPLEIDIQADGKTIFQNQALESYSASGYRKTYPVTTKVLNEGETETTDDDHDMNGELITEGQVLSLVVPSLNGAKGISINLVLNRVDQSEP